MWEAGLYHEEVSLRETLPVHASGDTVSDAIRRVLVIVLKIIWALCALVICLPLNVMLTWLARDNVRESVREFMVSLRDFLGWAPAVDRVVTWVRCLRQRP